MNKRILLTFVIAAMLFVLAGCTNTTTTPNAELKHYKAILLLPDGTLVRGECSDYSRSSNNWIRIEINGIEYRTNDWRVTIIEDED